MPLAAAVLSGEDSQVSLSDLSGCMRDGSKLSPRGFNLETDEKSSDRFKLEFGAIPSAVISTQG